LPESRANRRSRGIGPNFRPGCLPWPRARRNLPAGRRAGGRGMGRCGEWERRGRGSTRKRRRKRQTRPHLVTRYVAGGAQSRTENEQKTSRKRSPLPAPESRHLRIRRSNPPRPLLLSCHPPPAIPTITTQPLAAPEPSRPASLISQGRKARRETPRSNSSKTSGRPARVEVVQLGKCNAGNDLSGTYFLSPV
jgi:hypothetical protein